MENSYKLRGPFDYIAGYINSLEDRISKLEEQNRALKIWQKETIEMIEEIRVNIMQGFDPQSMKGAVELGIKDSLRPTELLHDHIEKTVRDQVQDWAETNVEDKFRSLMGSVEIDTNIRIY